MVGPIARSLDALLIDNFNTEFREKVREDFNIAGIEELFGQFISFNEVVKQQKLGLLNEIERLENEVCDQHKLLCDIKEKIQEKNQYAAHV